MEIIFTLLILTLLTAAAIKPKLGGYITVGSDSPYLIIAQYIFYFICAIIGLGGFAILLMLGVALFNAKLHLPGFDITTNLEVTDNDEDNITPQLYEDSSTPASPTNNKRKA